MNESVVPTTQQLPLLSVGAFLFLNHLCIPKFAYIHTNGWDMELRF